MRPKQSYWTTNTEGGLELLNMICEHVRLFYLKASETLIRYTAPWAPHNKGFYSKSDNIYQEAATGSRLEITCKYTQ